MLIQNFLEHSAENYPDKNAVWHNNTWTTYQQIEQKSNNVAHFLREKGISSGERICLLIDNSIEYIICYFAILKAGAVVVSINNETTPSNLNYYLYHSDARALITVEKFFPIVSQCDIPAEVAFIIHTGNWAHDKKIPFFSLYDIIENGSQIRPPCSSISIDLASIVYTSGSTGEPKGVMLSHQNLFDNTKSIVKYLTITNNDRMMVVLPFYYIYGTSLLLTHFCAGGSLVISNKFVFPNVVIDMMIKHSVTGFAGVPSTFTLLLHNSSIRNTEISSLRYVTQAGGAMAPPIQHEIAAIFSPAKLYIMYGTTEAAPRLTYLEPEMLLLKSGSIGKAIPNVQVIIADENGNPVPHGETGEIAARGSNIMLGYWKDPLSTASVIRNGFYYTGDIGKTDKDGFIYVVGRKKEMIKVGGNRVSAKEIEEALISLPEIKEAAAIGVPDTILGEAVKAFVVLKEESKADTFSIKQKLFTMLPQYKIPKYFDFRNSLPKNESGKIMKEMLKKG